MVRTHIATKFTSVCQNERIRAGSKGPIQVHSKGVPVKRRFVLSLVVLFFSLTAAASDRVNLPQCRGIKVTAEMRETVREAKADPRAAYGKKHRKVPAAVTCESA